MGRSKSSLYTTRDQSDQIEWRKFRPTANRRGSQIGVVKFTLDSNRFGQSRQRQRKTAKTVQFKRNLTRSSGDLTRSGEISLDPVRFSLDLAEISLDLMRSPKSDINLVDLKYFDQKLTKKSLDRGILISFMVELVEAGFRGENRQSQFLGSIAGGSILVSFGGWVRSNGWVDTPTLFHVAISSSTY